VIRSRLVVAGVLVAAAVGACGSQQSPNWTFVPASAQAAASATGASPAAGASASAAAASAPSASPSPPTAAESPSPAAASPGGGASGAPGAGGSTLNLAAKNIAYDQSSLTAPANTPLTIHFDNQDTGVGHDVAIHAGSADGQLEFQGNVIVGPASVDYQVPALPPGTYTIICIIHPTQMVATLTVK
jgi:plastocyanin